MSGFRFEIEAFPHPDARVGRVGGGWMQLVRVRLFDGPDVVDDNGRPTGRPDAFIDLRPGDARHLALELLAAARHAERLTEGSGR